ncbi:MAG TPA: mechanosensitive ion channel family protein [Casimicrobiaceae bacterium]|nr:mechanosensitive ion channel family protein [Casimicrobiaceae bacterium]
MEFNFGQATAGVHQLVTSFTERLPYMAIALIVFVAFYVGGILLKKATLTIVARTRRHRSVGIVLGRLGQGLLVLLGLLIGLVVAVPGFTPGQLVSVLGLSSVAIGFAFRDILQNFLAGILLLLSEPFRIGDQIKSGDFEGTVSNIETRATSITTYDGRRIVVPNSTLFVNPVTVNTAGEKRRLEYDMKLPKDTDIAKLKHAMLRTIERLPHVLTEPSPDVLLVGFTENDVTLRIRWWIQPPRHYELQRGVDTVLTHVRETLQALKPAAAAPKQPAVKNSA